MTEDQIQKAVVQFARAKYKNKLLCFSIPNEHYTNPIRGKKLNDLGRISGVPDLLLIKKMHPAPEYLHLELKSKKGRLSPNQKEFLSLLDSFNCNASVAYNLDDALSIIENFMKKDS